MLKNNSQKRIYLDFASETPTSKKVLQEMKKVQSKNYNPSNIYKEGEEAESVLHEARVRVARVLGVRDHEIYFALNSSLSISSAIFGTLNYYKSKNIKNYIKPHIITSNIEHAAVLENIKYLERAGEIEASYIACDEFGILDPIKIKNAIKENTILVSIIYANNELGTIQDIKNISKKIKEWKRGNRRKENAFPYFHTDASQAGNYLSLYIDMLGVDMMSFNGSKIYGPKSSAILFKKESIKISPFYFGGGQERGLFSGTVDIEKVAGLSVAIEEAQKNIKNEKVLESIATKRNDLLENILKNIPDAKLNGAWNENDWKKEKVGIAREDRIAKRLPNNLSIYLSDFPSDEMTLRLDQRGFAVSAGSACSAKSDEYSHVIYAITKSKKVARETIRVTIDKDTKEEDLDRFVKVLKEIYYKFRK
ncbi:MAG: hypothetical protein RI945_114 [Candidatus Parcubacteria bacterium]|jgi:cysteine desulfurase